MIVLDANNRSLIALLGAAVSANQLPITAHYVDITATTFTPKFEDSVSNDTSEVTIMSAPSSSTQRMLKSLTIFNADTSAATVTIKYNDNSTKRTLFTVTLDPGESLAYNKMFGWHVLDVNGYPAVCPTSNNLSHQADVGWALHPTPPNSGTQSMTNQTIFAYYIGRARKSFSSVDMAVRVTTAAATITYCEMAVLKGEPSLIANPNLSLVSYLDVSAILNGTGFKSGNINTAGKINIGDSLWLAISSNATTALVLRTLNYTGQSASGLYATLASTRASTMSNNSTFTPSSTNPFWLAWKLNP